MNAENLKKSFEEIAGATNVLVGALNEFGTAYRSMEDAMRALRAAWTRFEGPEAAPHPARREVDILEELRWIREELQRRDHAAKDIRTPA